MSVSFLERLQKNRFMRSHLEVAEFEAALEDAAIVSDPALLRELHLVLDDGCQHDEVMFGLVHLLESFDVKAQLQALIDVLPQLVDQAASWSKTLHFRILNDEEARGCYQRLLSRASGPGRVTALSILAAIAESEDEPLKGAAKSLLNCKR